MRDDRTEMRRATAWMSPTAVEELDSARAWAALDDTPGDPAPEYDDGCEPEAATLEPGRLYRKISGRDAQPRPVTKDELAALGDPMAVEFFGAGRFPTTVEALLSELPEAAVAKLKVYLISEAGQIPPDAIGERAMRFAIATAVRGSQVDFLVSTRAGAADPVQAFLQVAAWDPKAKVFNFYARVGSSWVWAGNSWDALQPDSRGKGCFDSHINGSVVMKELRLPWINWQSERATIRIAENDPLRHDPLYQRVVGAQGLELTVRSLITRWTAARLAAVTANGVVDHPDRLLRHLFTSTAVNLASTDRQSSNVTLDSDDLMLPMGLWLNQDVLFNDLRLSTQATPPGAPAALYLASLTRFDFRLQEKQTFSQPGDTFFAFVVPEAAHEDNEVVRQMIRKGLISARFAACVLMVDFPNPVFSPARSHLMRYVPTTPTKTAALCDKIAQAITDAAADLPTDSPEGRFAAHWQVPDDTWRTVFGQRVAAYLRKITERIGTESGFDDYVRLAESRRRQFRVMKLNEFDLTLPVTNIPPNAPLLAMREDATIAELKPACP
ncbi:hypothetical protein J7F01_14785 [Streptomyces sp. ISL-22]|uniref:hypothetical protein n=1 Tax=unclassified Streptomyces TaxID=2593676 RepID=UPI001BE93CEF|nr:MULTISPECIES: hypothetical protein [unclassified Streptomyces]MBT2421891.1 hypothetical protein [Streptomyces sp. ISL-24]MBT2433441.1 hypothetical protein [Streptomyces sp. ISL-22]